MEQNMITFAKRMQEARRQCNLKQKELADAIGVTPQTVSAYEKNADGESGKKPTLENAVAIALKLGVSLDWLCGIERSNDSEQNPLTLGQVARNLVSASSIDGFSLETITELEYDENGEEWTSTDTVIKFRFGELRRFLIDWKKIKTLRDSYTIDENLYQLWLNDRYTVLNDLPSGKVTNGDSDGECPF